MTDETTALLIRARGFVERGWCRIPLAVDSDGNDVIPTNERAVAWCMYGALYAAGFSESPGYFSTPENRLPAVRRLRAAIGGGSIAHFNKRQKTVEPILAAFDRAIAACGSP